MLLVALCLSSTVALQAETRLKVEFSFENAEFDDFANEKALQDSYNGKWEAKKEAFINNFLQSLESHLKGHGYTIVQEGSADYTLRVDVRELNMDAEITAKAILSDTEKISKRRYKVDGDNNVDSYLMMPSTTFGRLADVVYREQFRRPILRNNLPSTQPRKLVTDIMLEAKCFSDIYQSVNYSAGLGAQFACDFNLKGLVYVAAGFGIARHEYYYNEMDADIEIPVFAQAKYLFLPRRVSPYLSGQVGYTFGKMQFDGWYKPHWLENSGKYNLGLYYQANLGVHVQLNHGAIQAEWGVKHQNWECKLKERDFVNFSVGYTYTIRNMK